MSFNRVTDHPHVAFDKMIPQMIRGSFLCDSGHVIAVRMIVTKTSIRKVVV